MHFKSLLTPVHCQWANLELLPTVINVYFEETTSDRRFKLSEDVTLVITFGMGWLNKKNVHRDVG